MTDQAKFFDIWREVKMSSLMEVKKAPEKKKEHLELRAFKFAFCPSNSFR